MSVCVKMHQWWKTCICNTSPGYLETATLTFQPLLCCFWLSMANMFLHCRFSHIRNESTAHLERLLGAAVTSERPCVKARLFFQSFQYVKLWSQPGRKGPADSWMSEIGVCVFALMLLKACVLTGSVLRSVWKPSMSACSSLEVRPVVGVRALDQPARNYISTKTLP